MLAKRASIVVVLLAAALGCAGCGASDDAEPRKVASSFAQAVSAGDGAGACRLLAPETRSQVEESEGKKCAAALPGEDLPKVTTVTKTSTFGMMAQVTFAGDTMFLSEFPGGWRVTAAGCSPVPGEPYDCHVQGG